MNPPIPDEDKFLCIHKWCELNEGEGIDNRDPYVGLVTFYCEKCLAIRIKSYRIDRFYRSKDWLGEYFENRDEGDSGARQMP